jgi:hypothetical protein
MMGEVGWSIDQIAMGNLEHVSWSDVQTDLLDLTEHLENYAKFLQERKQYSPEATEFSNNLLPAIQRLKSAIKKT